MASSILFQNSNFQRTLKILILLIGFGIFFIDIITPLGVTSGSAYTICIFMCYWIKESRAVFVVAFLCCIAILFGYIISPEAVFSLSIIIFNRTFSILAVLFSAAFTYNFRITTLKHSDNELEHRSTLESAYESILVINREGEIIYTNERTQKIFGYGQTELIGKKIEILVPPEIREKHILLREQYAQKPIIRRMGTGGNIEAVRKDNSRFPVEISLGHFNTHKGYFVTCFITDISARKIAEDALNQKNIELQESNRKLKILNSEKEQFLYATSHEMQEPIRMIANYAQLLEKKYPDEFDIEKKEYRNIIKKEAKRMKQLLVAVSEYINMNIDEDLREEVNCNIIVNEAIKQLKFQFTKTGAQIKIENELPIVQGNKTQLLKVFIELLDNAIKFKGEETPLISISSEEKSGEWLFIIKDNGLYLDPKYEDRIFKIFKKLHIHDEYQGPGIGLAIAHKVVTQHGGKIWYESMAGKGTAFYFTIKK